ncbi:cytochrome P450 [Streptomyces sp. NPDC092296]|uniref:cytochrome P450 n=1 Tax=Streptomyces sp. NPDC092296 TaxID=3366012 RepID=UPI0037FF9CA1
MTVASDEGTASDRSLVPLHCTRFAASGPPRPAELPNGTAVWTVSRYRDARQVLTDPRFSRSLLHADDAPPLDDTFNLVDDPALLFNQDGPDHQRLRRTVQRAFTPRAVAHWRPWVSEVVERLLDELVGKEPPVDIVAAFTLPLPVAVVSRLMGLDGLDVERLRYWSDHVLAYTADNDPQAAAVLTEFAEFSAELISARRGRPGDDLVSTLLRAADEVGDIPEDQLVSLVGGLTVGGHDSTMTALSNSLVYLLGERPESWSRLGGDLSAAEAVGERLLHWIPLGDDPGSTRRAAEDVEVGGVTIPAGSVVVVDVGSASRDPEVYPSGPFGDLFAPMEGPTLAFGAGPHHCLGAWLIRMELPMALNRLAARLPGLRLSEPVDAIEWREGGTTRSPKRLVVTW